MFGRSKKAETPEAVGPLKDAVRDARIEAAERSAVVVDLRDAELARLELLNEALDPVFKEIPDDVELFDRGLSRGDVPRLWVDVVAHVEMGRDKRQYRFVQDTRYGRAVLGEILRGRRHRGRRHALCGAAAGGTRARAHRRCWPRGGAKRPAQRRAGAAAGGRSVRSCWG